VARPRLGTVVGVTVLAAAAGVGGWVYWNATEKDRVIAEQKRVIAALEQKLDRSWASELVADLKIDGVRGAANGLPPEIAFTFIQYANGSETPVFKQQMTVTGEEIYIDALVVKFERKFVEAGDGLRGKSLLMFRRAFGDHEKPIDGAPLYRQVGEAPIPETLQVDSTPSEFERQIWERFWQLASDPEAARVQGIAVIQGEAPHIKPVQGQVYKLTLRAAGGLDIQPRLPAAVLGDARAP
jgi:hypothetical protein